MMFEYILRLLSLLPLGGGRAWGSLWLWKRVQMGVPLVGGGAKTRAIEMVDVLPLGPGSKLAVVEFAGQRVLIAVSRNGITRIADDSRSEEHTSELQSLMRISYAGFCLNKKKRYVSNAGTIPSTRNTSRESISEHN